MQPFDGKGIAIVALSAAASANTIPQTARATLAGKDPATAVAMSEAARADFINKYEQQGGSFSIDIQKGDATVDVKVTGTSAHGSRPEEGVNPLPRLALFLRESGISLVENHYASALSYLNDLYGTDYLGMTLGVSYTDDFMGPLTMSPTLVRENGGRLEVTANVRMPRGRGPDELKNAVVEKINTWVTGHQVDCEISYSQGAWMARDPKGAWLGTLLNIFSDVSGLEAKPVSTAGSTTAKLLPNAINFGPAIGVRPFRWTASCCGFDQALGVLILEVDGAAVAEG
jgi:acetylornithine deacetylase/succinyl-diaminopimelate desuccinylase-like protein